MSAWINITVADLESCLVSAQVTALRTSALAEGQADPFDDIMPARCSYVRNRISKRLLLSSQPFAVPPELKTQTCWLILEAMQARLSGLALTDEQKEMIRCAKKDLDIAGTEDLPISLPDDPIASTAQRGSSAQLTSSTPRMATRATLGGL